MGRIHKFGHAFLIGAVVGVPALAIAQSPLAELEAKSKDLILAARQVASADDSVRFTKDCFTFIDAATAADEFALAQRIAILAADSATKVGNAHCVALSQSRKSDVMFMVREWRQLTASVKRLASSPDDPAANFALGRFQCVVKGDWAAGRMQLLKGNNPEWKSAAELDEKAEADAATGLAAGDAWAAVARTEKAPFNGRIDLRAHSWYRPLLLKATGDDRKSIQEKMQTLSLCYLTDFDESEVRAGAWPLGKYGNRGVDGMIHVNAFDYVNGLGMHPNDGGETMVRFPIGGAYRTLRTGVALNDHTAAFGGSISFAVYGDGKLLWKSPQFKQLRTALFADIPVKGVQNLELRTAAVSSAVGGHAVWLDPILLK